MGVGAYGPKSLISFITVLVDGGGVGCILQYGRIIISLILYIPCIGFWCIQDQRNIYLD